MSPHPRRRFSPRFGRSQGRIERISGGSARGYAARRHAVRHLRQQCARFATEQRGQAVCGYPHAGQTRMEPMERPGDRPASSGWACVGQQDTAERMCLKETDGRPQSSARRHRLRNEREPQEGAGHHNDHGNATDEPCAADRSAGHPVPEGRGELCGALADFQEAQALFDRLSTLLDRIAQGPAGEVYLQELIRTNFNGKAVFACAAVRAARNKLVAAQPYCGYCPNCYAQRPARGYSFCKSCGGRGWTSQAAFESCREFDRQQILKMRSANSK